jgi:hypothetical protein
MTISLTVLYQNVMGDPLFGWPIHKLDNKIGSFFLTNLQKCKIIYIEQLMTNEIVGCPVSSLMVYCYFAKGRIKGKSL